MGGLGVVGSDFENRPNNEKEKYKGKRARTALTADSSRDK